METDLGRGHLHKVMQTALLVRSSGQVLAIMTLKKGTSWGSTQNKRTQNCSKLAFVLAVETDQPRPLWLSRYPQKESSWLS